MGSVASIILLIACVVGILSYWKSDTSDIHNTYRKLWGARLVSFVIMIFATQRCMRLIDDFSVIVCFIFVWDVILFIYYAVAEYKIRQIFVIHTNDFLNKIK